MPGNPSTPPRFYERLFRFFCKEELYNELQGDLDEEFFDKCETLGLRKARTHYRKEVLKMIRPSIIKKLKFLHNITFTAMFKINAKLALRNLVNHKLYTAINIGGLAISIAVCGLILLYVQSETNYDNYHPESDRLYRLALDRVYPDHVSHYAVTPMGIAKQVAIDHPEIESMVRIFPGFGVNITIEDETFLEDDFLAVDTAFFSMFGIKLLRGNPANVLKTPNAAILTESAAIKYFGSTDIIGKTFTSGFGELIVNGITEDVPENTHFKFNMLVPMELMTQNFLDDTNFVNFAIHAYFRLREGVSPEQAMEKVNEVVETYAAGQLERDLRISFEDYKASGNGYNYFLQKVTDIHLTSHLEREFEANGNITYVIIFSSVAVFIIILAAINFINLATARSAERAKEVGIRKVLGSGKGSLINQFLIESIMVSSIAMILGIGLVYLLLPAFNDFTGKFIQLHVHEQPLTIITLLAIAIALGFLAGIYPAFVLSSFRPVVVLKGKLIRSKSGGWIRNGLVVFQFFVSVVLICSTLIVGQQMDYLQNRSLGFDKDNVLMVDRIFGVQDIQTFRNVLSNIPGVKTAAATSAMPGQIGYFGMSFRLQGAEDEVVFNCVVFQDGYPETMGMELVTGRTFSRDFEDSLSIVLNESAARVLGILDDPVGKTVTNLQGGNNPIGDANYRVIGVVKDYNYKSLHTEITPLAMFSHESTFGGFLGAMALRVDNHSRELLSAVETTWNDQAQGQPFIYQYLDDSLFQLYTNEARSGELFFVFTTIAILIACIGLFGLATFIIASRIKEIGVRKVLGASSSKVVMLIIGDFNKLILIALLISVPVVVLVMQNWLSGFAYHISLGSTWISFVIGGVIALFVAWLTVSYHSIRAAIANPVKNLRTE